MVWAEWIQSGVSSDLADLADLGGGCRCGVLCSSEEGELVLRELVLREGAPSAPPASASSAAPASASASTPTSASTAIATAIATATATATATTTATRPTSAPSPPQVHELLGHCLGAAEEAALSPYERVLLAILRDDPFATIEQLRADEAFGEGCRPPPAAPLPLAPRPWPCPLPPSPFPVPP